jgi:hypothetical protein
MTNAELVDKGSALDARIKNDIEELKKIKAELIALGPGDYTGDSGRRAKVIQPAAKITPPLGDKLDIVRNLMADEDFKSLFDRIVAWNPVKSCRDVAARILSPGQLKKFLGLCEKESAAYVLFQ